MYADDSALKITDIIVTQYEHLISSILETLCIQTLTQYTPVFCDPPIDLINDRTHSEDNKHNSVATLLHPSCLFPLGNQCGKASESYDSSEKSLFIEAFRSENHSSLNVFRFPKGLINRKWVLQSITTTTSDCPEKNYTAQQIKLGYKSCCHRTDVNKVNMNENSKDSLSRLYNKRKSPKRTHEINKKFRVNKEQSACFNKSQLIFRGYTNSRNRKTHSSKQKCIFEQNALSSSTVKKRIDKRRYQKITRSKTKPPFCRFSKSCRYKSYIVNKVVTMSQSSSYSPTGDQKCFPTKRNSEPKNDSEFSHRENLSTSFKGQSVIPKTQRCKRKTRKFNFDSTEVANYQPSRRKDDSSQISPQKSASSSTVRLIDKILSDPEKFDKKTIDQKFEKKFKKSKNELRFDSFLQPNERISSTKDKKLHKFKSRNKTRHHVGSSTSDSSKSSSSPAKPHSRILTQPLRCPKPRLKNRSRSLDTFQLPLNPTEVVPRGSLRLDSSNEVAKIPNCVDTVHKTETLAILNRLDSVLSNLVEKEKRRIQYLEVNNPRQRDRSLDNQPPARPTTLDIISQKRPRSSQSNMKKRLIHRHPTPADVMEQHKDWFTELKPYRPRILKSDIKAKLLSYRCYQKPKRSKSSTGHTERQVTSENESCSSERPTTMSGEEIVEDIAIASTSHVVNEATSDLDKKNPEEDEDTCYGSDMVPSDTFTEKPHPQLHVFPKFDNSNDPDVSIDSAYNGSREATPDLQREIMKKNSNFKDHSTNSREIKSSQILNGNTPGKRIEQGRSYLLSEIKRLGLYSDTEINTLLAEYQVKWEYVPGRELSIIVRSIRKDLGVQAPPTECVAKLLSSSNITSKQYGFEPILNKPSFSDSSRKEYMQALSKALPFHSRSSEKMAICSYAQKSPKKIRSSFDTTNSKYDLKNNKEDHTLPDNNTSMSTITQELSDENWAKSVLGDNSYLVEEAKKSIDENATLNSDWNKVADDLCSKFDLHL